MGRPGAWEHARVRFERSELRGGLVLATVIVLVLGITLALQWSQTRNAGPDGGEVVPPTVAPGFVPPGDSGRTGVEGFDEIAITVEPGRGAPPLFWCLLAALNATQRNRGLMEVTDLGGYDGMVFVYQADTTNPFYMRNTPTALSIAWVAEDGHVVSIKDMAPCRDRQGCPRYAPGGPYRYAIETFQGDLPDLGITEEATVAVGGACAPA